MVRCELDCTPICGVRISGNRARAVSERCIRVLARCPSRIVNVADRGSTKAPLGWVEGGPATEGLSDFFTKARRGSFGRADGGGRGEPVKRAEGELTAIGVDRHQIMAQERISEDAVDTGPGVVQNDRHLPKRGVTDLK